MLLGSTARLLLLAAAMLFFSGAVNAEPDAPLAAALQTGSPSGASVDAAAMQSLRQFYEDRGNRYAWTSPDNGGEPNAAGRAVLAFLQTVSRDGLNPKAYTIPDTVRGTDAEMAIATALLRYSIDVRSASNPKKTTLNCSGRALPWIRPVSCGMPRPGPKSKPSWKRWPPGRWNIGRFARPLWPTGAWLYPAAGSRCRAL